MSSAQAGASLWELKQHGKSSSIQMWSVLLTELHHSQCFNFWEYSDCMSHNHLPKQWDSRSVAGKPPSLTPERFILIGSSEAFQRKGSYIFWESLPVKARATFVAPGQMQLSRKLLECCVTPLPVPAPGDIQISTQGSCTNSGYLALMEDSMVY